MIDQFGNELKVGDFVLCDLSQPYIMGRIIATKKGGIALAAGAGQPPVTTPDIITVESTFSVSIPFNMKVKKVVGPQQSLLAGN